jgi:hypothetical protein
VLAHDSRDLRFQCLGLGPSLNHPPEVACTDWALNPTPERLLGRYQRSMSNLSAGLNLADRAYLYDNSVERVEARLCARTNDGQLRKLYGPLPGWVDDALRGLPRHPDFSQPP